MTWKELKQKIDTEIKAHGLCDYMIEVDWIVIDKFDLAKGVSLKVKVDDNSLQAMTYGSRYMVGKTKEKG